MHAPLAQLRFTTGRPCPTCFRGAIATQDIPTDELVAAVPLSLGLRFPRLTYDPDRHGYACEYAYEIMKIMKTDPKFNATYDIFWATQPTFDDILTVDTITDDLVSMLHCPELVRLIENQREATRSVFYGNYSLLPYYKPLNEQLPPDQQTTLEEFIMLTGIIGSRDFALSEEAKIDEHKTAAVFLLPAVDMFNHEDDANAIRNDNGTHVLVTALKDIKKGEAITNNYQTNVIHRNDISMYIYGFAQDSSMELMLATDLPTYDPLYPWLATEPDDSKYYGPGGEHNTKKEMERLEALLQEAQARSTIQEDEKLLKSGTLKNWKEEMVVKFRLGRKKTLKKAIKLIDEVLNADDEYQDVDDDEGDSSAEQVQVTEGPDDEYEDEPPAKDEL